MNKSKPLKLQEFREWEIIGGINVPKYNNLILYFINDTDQNIRRKNEKFKRFQREHPALERDLTSKITATWRCESKTNKERCVPYEEELYEAYKIMRDYVYSDDDLFR